MWSPWKFQHDDDRSAVTTAMLILSSFAAASYLYTSHRRRGDKLRSLPRPESTLPVLGNTLDLIGKHRTRLHDWFLDECLRHKGQPWLLQSLGRPDSIILTNESHFEDVLKNQFEIFEKGPQTREVVVDFSGKQGIFGLDGAAWRHQRKIASNLFSHHMLREIMAQAIAEDTRVVLRKLSRSMEAKTRLDLKLLMEALSTDVFTKIGFGVTLGCLQGDGANKSDFDASFHRAFSRCPMVIQSRSQQPMFLWKLKRFLNIGEEKQLARDLRRINGAVFKIVEESMARFHTGVADMTKEKNLISLFLEKNTGDEVETTPELIRDVAMNFIAAGRGATGQSLTWFLVMMNRYPDVHRKVLEEMALELPWLFHANKSNAIPSMEDVSRLTFLEAAIRESLRLNPAAPINARVAMQDTVLSDGTFIPKGTRVIIPTYATARLPWIWGHDASDFKPERWIDPTTNTIKHVSPFKFLVFHAGPRICLGVKLAMLEMKIALAAMLSKFELVTERDPFEISYDMSLSLPIRGELMAVVRPVAVDVKRHDMAEREKELVATVA